MMLAFSLIAKVALANMGPPPDIAPPCTVAAMCGHETKGQTCTHAPSQEPPCEDLADQQLTFACTVGLPGADGMLTSVYCVDPFATAPGPPPPASTRRCGAVGAAAVVPMVLLGLWRREDVRQL